MMDKIFIIEKLNVRGTSPNTLYLHQQMVELRGGYNIYVYHTDRLRELKERIKKEKLTVNINFTTLPCDHWIIGLVYKGRRRKDIGVK